jgi:fumarate reductase flavoprotein subunit
MPWPEALRSKNPDIYEAETIEDLATKIGINPVVLKATIQEYNGFCAKGHDDLFAKKRKYLRPLKKPKFYALRCYIRFLGTLGGIKVNHMMEAIDRNGRPLPGLYAGGLDAGGLYGDSYDVTTAGGTLAFAVNSGRLAGKSVLRYLGK